MASDRSRSNGSLLTAIQETRTLEGMIDGYCYHSSKLDCFALFSQSMILGPESESMPQKANQALTVRDVAAYLNVDEKTIYRLAQRGELPGFKVAGAWRFQSADLQRWIDQRKRLSARPKGKGLGIKR
jgi:excisionase family DNA binding protein